LRSPFSLAEVSETLVAASVVAVEPPVPVVAWEVRSLPELEDPVEDGLLGLEDPVEEELLDDADDVLVAELGLLEADEELVDAGQESA
jgi:hypothetical protein